MVQVDRESVSLTIYSKRGGQESKVVIGESASPDNVHPLDGRR